MPCHSAIVKDSVTSSPNDSVEDVLDAIKKKGVIASAIIGEEGEFLGIFSMKVLLKNLIPVSVAMSDGVQIDLKVPAAPGVAKRLSNVKTVSVSELMERQPASISPDAPIWEGVNALIKNGGPLSVVDDNGKFCGFITYDSLVQDLESMTSVDA